MTVRQKEVTAVKAAVRQRDGNRCRRCGRTSEENRERFGRELEVHRIVPRSLYSLGGCITLCRSCHANMPQALAYLFESDPEDTGIALFGLFLHEPEDHRLWSALKALAEQRGTSYGDVIREAIANHVGIGND